MSLQLLVAFVLHCSLETGDCFGHMSEQIFTSVSDCAEYVSHQVETARREEDFPMNAWCLDPMDAIIAENSLVRGNYDVLSDLLQYNRHLRIW